MTVLFLRFALKTIGPSGGGFSLCQRPLRIGVFEKGGTEMEKKTYESMDLEVVRFQTEDVITASVDDKIEDGTSNLAVK